MSFVLHTHMYLIYDVYEIWKWFCSLKFDKKLAFTINKNTFPFLYGFIKIESETMVEAVLFFR